MLQSTELILKGFFPYVWKKAAAADSLEVAAESAAPGPRWVLASVLLGGGTW